DVGGASHVGERHTLLRRALDGELVLVDLDVLGRGLEFVGDDGLGLVGNFYGATSDRLTAHGGRARAVRVAALGTGAGVAVNDLDHRRIDAEPIGGDLREGGLLPLSMWRGAGVDRDRAGVVDTDHCRLPQTGLDADPVGAGYARRREPADLGVGREPNPA